MRALSPLPFAPPPPHLLRRRLFLSPLPPSLLPPPFHSPSQRFCSSDLVFLKCSDVPSLTRVRKRSTRRQGQQRVGTAPAWFPLLSPLAPSPQWFLIPSALGPASVCFFAQGPLDFAKRTRRNTRHVSSAPLAGAQPPITSPLRPLLCCFSPIKFSGDRGSPFRSCAMAGRQVGA